MKSKKTAGLLQGKEGMRIAALVATAIVLAMVLFGGFGSSGNPGKVPDENSKRIDLKVDVPKLDLDAELLGTVRDSTPAERLVIEADVASHLLAAANGIVPGTLRAMGLGKNPMSVATLRANPDRYRGKPVAFEGRLAEFKRDANPISGMPRYNRTVGRITTDDGSSVVFAILAKIPESLPVDSYVRIEGIFFKLYDAHFGFEMPVRSVPYVVGFALQPAYPRFDPVSELDNEVLAKARDTTDSQQYTIEPEPLYHLASYVMNLPKEGGWKADLPDITREDAKDIVNATRRVPRGSGFKVLAALYDVQILAAEPNPLGIDYWTRAWVEHPDAQTIEVRMPGRLDGVWNKGDFVFFHGFFLKARFYETLDGSRKTVPFLITDKISHWQLLENPENHLWRFILTTITVLLILLLGLLVVRDSKADQAVRDRILERRRRRRTKARA